MKHTLPIAPLLVRLPYPLGKLPDSITIEFPPALAKSLVRRKLATPVADLATYADIAIDEEDLQHCGVDLWSIEADTSVLAPA